MLTAPITDPSATDERREMCRHDGVDYLKRLVGVDHIGIGSDFGADKFTAPLPRPDIHLPVSARDRIQSDLTACGML